MNAAPNSVERRHSRGRPMTYAGIASAISATLAAIMLVGGGMWWGSGVEGDIEFARTVATENRTVLNERRSALLEFEAFKQRVSAVEVTIQQRASDRDVLKDAISRLTIQVGIQSNQIETLKESIDVLNETLDRLAPALRAANPPSPRRDR